MTGSRFSVLFVSTGNVCRSPLAERLLRYRLAGAVGDQARWFRCESAGTWGHEGAPMEANTARVLTELGADPSGFVARELSTLQVRLADLILVAGREHGEQIRLFDPYAAARTFCLNEFVRLAREVEVGPLIGTQGGGAPDLGARTRALLAAVAAVRRPEADAATSDEIGDPYGAPLHVFRLCAQTVAGSVEGLVTTLTGVRSRGTGRSPAAVG